MKAHCFDIFDKHVYTVQREHLMLQNISQTNYDFKGIFLKI
jgi:hypothetical protein